MTHTHQNRIAAVDGGTYYHHATLNDPRWSHLIDRVIYAPELANADLSDVVNDDVVLLGLQYSTQWDSLAHVGSRFDADGDGVAEAVFYNGFRAGEEIRPGVEDRRRLRHRRPRPVRGPAVPGLVVDPRRRARRRRRQPLGVPVGTGATAAPGRFLIAPQLPPRSRSR